MIGKQRGQHDRLAKPNRAMLGVGRTAPRLHAYYQMETDIRIEGEITEQRY